MTRVAMWSLLVIVAAASAVLSFSALRDLALLCGFARGLAWLLPVVIDAGAAAGCLVWLGGDSDDQARRFARSPTITRQPRCDHPQWACRMSKAIRALTRPSPAQTILVPAELAVVLLSGVAWRGYSGTASQPADLTRAR